MRLNGFPPIVCENSRILILGSFPSKTSLAEGMYYGYSRNHFWPLLARLLETPVPITTEEKIALLQIGRIALWDLVCSCERSGSLDQNILVPELNDIIGLLTAYPAIKRVLLNGSLAANLFYRKGIRYEGPLPAIGAAWSWQGFGEKELMVYRLPSTSPVPSRQYRNLEDKLPVWKEALR